jgi:cysteinyl-tRNA synthetase
MDLRLYDTLTKEKRTFVPLDPANVRMYVCGPTVYDFAHIGNARPVIVFDILFRLLRHIYGADHVTYVRNITDVDDKINDRAARDFPGLPLNEAIRKVTGVTEKQFHEDIRALGVLTADDVNETGRPARFIEPRATEHIAEMRVIIEKLVQGGFAYIAEDHVLFSPQAMNEANSILPRYGALANRTLDEMIAGARVDVAPYKRDATDFVLWKPSKPGEPSWPSPSGISAAGRPGWHIECSAMAWKHLGEQFDIHGGGIDLVFPHHENELAQTCCAFHEGRMANVWMHNGFLQVEGDKMSKSTGNFVTINELLTTEKFGGQKWDGDTLRFAMLQTHYRQPIDWTVSNLLQSEKRLQAWKNFAADRTRSQLNFELFEEVIDSLCNDLTTPTAFALIDRIVSSEHADTRDRYTVYKILKTLGLKGGQSNAAKLSNEISRLWVSLSQLPPRAWKELSTEVEMEPKSIDGNLRKSVQLLTSFGALEALLSDVQLIVSDTLADERLSPLFHIAQEQAKSKRNMLRSKIANMAFARAAVGSKSDWKWRQFGREESELLEELSDKLVLASNRAAKFSENDWKSISAGVERNPMLNSGKMKAGTQLLANIDAFNRLWNEVWPEVAPAMKSEIVREQIERLITRLSKKRSSFEIEIASLIAARAAARARKDFKESDRIRDQLAAMGVVIKDSKEGTTWEVAR